MRQTRECCIVATALGVLIASGWLEGAVTGRWRSSVDSVAAHRLSDISREIGDWSGEDAALSPDELSVSGAETWLSRRYVHRTTGAWIHAIVVGGRPGPIAVHAPPTCYVGSGFEIVDGPRLQMMSVHDGALSRPVQFSAARFQKSASGVTRRVNTLWSWSAGGSWSVPENPRITFGRQPRLFKLHVYDELNERNTPRANSLRNEFLAAFVGEVGRVLFGRASLSASPQPAPRSLLWEGEGHDWSGNRRGKTRRVQRSVGRRTRGVTGSHPFYVRAKRFGDVVAASVLLVLSSPLIVLLAALVRLTSRGPAFYSQVRVGRDGQLYKMYKLRSMVQDAERATGAQWSSGLGDPRVTRLGRFLRGTHLDELPQLWNVVRGDMALVGPRPERPEFVEQLDREIPDYRGRLQVRPGITGLAQVWLPADSSTDTVRRKLKYDLQYLRQLSPLLDVKLLSCTALYLMRVPFERSARWMRVIRPTLIDGDFYRELSQSNYAEVEVSRMQAARLESAADAEAGLVAARADAAANEQVLAVSAQA